MVDKSPEKNPDSISGCLFVAFQLLIVSLIVLIIKAVIYSA